jgi:hypothetical protein
MVSRTFSILESGKLAADTFTFCSANNKKAGVAEHLTVFSRAGLLFDGPPSKAGPPSV